MTNPLDFVTNFLKQPYPTAGLAPSTVNVKTGGTVVQAGGGADGIGKTGESMWARIAAAVPFGWTLGGIPAINKAGSTATEAVTRKVNEGAQATQGIVKTISSTVTSTIGWTKWILIAAVAAAVVILLAQFKSLFRNP